MVKTKFTLAEEIQDRRNPDAAASFAVLTWIMVSKHRKLKTLDSRMRCAVKVLIGRVTRTGPVPVLVWRGE